MSIIDVIKESKLHNYTDIMSDQEVIQTILSGVKPTGTSGNREFIQELSSLKDPDSQEIINVAADMFQSITNSARTTREILEHLYANYSNESINLLSNFIKIVHAKDYTLKIDNPNDTALSKIKNKQQKLSQLPFSVKKEKLSTKEKDGASIESGLFRFEETYGLYRQKAEKEDELYSVEEILFSKANIDKAKKDETEGKSTKNIIVNNCKISDEKQEIIESKLDTSMSFILIDSPDIKIGTRNSIELATFFNLLSTIELSKCMPYFDATFLIPSLTPSSPGSTSRFRSASITQFLKGTPENPGNESYVYKTLNKTYEKSVGSKKVDGVETNMSIFTTPQTLNFFDEIMIGHHENVEDYLFNQRVERRPTTIHDITRPFMTIKSFSIDVAPTQGLMSFKTGKISLVIHDRTRIQDIAPFVKPDMFGSYGSEIVVEYGWANIDAINEDEKDKNYLGDFLNQSRVVEKYIITNSSFSMDNNGQVNVDLSIAARGPIDIRNVVFKTDALEAMNLKAAQKHEVNYKNKNVEFTEKYKIEVNSGIFSAIYGEVSRDYRDTKNMNSMFTSSAKLFTQPHPSARNTKGVKLTKYKYLVNNFIKKKSKLNLDTKLADIINEFNKFTRKKDDKEVLTDMPSVAIGFTINGNDPSGTIGTKSKNSKVKFADMTVRNLWERSVYEKAKEATALKQTNPSAPTNQTQAQTTPAAPSLQADHQFLIDFKDSLLNILESSNKVYGRYSNVKRRRLDEVKDVIKKIIGGLSEADPFYNKEFTERYNRIILNKNTGGNKIPINTISSKLNGPSLQPKGTQYVSLGSFITGLIGSHLVSTGKFNEIQIVSYTTNHYAGLFSNLNVASLLIDRADLYDYLENLFLEGGEFTVESIISQVVNEFLITRSSINYGLNKFYVKDKNKTTKARRGKIKIFDERTTLNTQTVALQQESVSKIIKLISLGLEQGNLKKQGEVLYSDMTAQPDSYKYLDTTKFVMPKIKLTFDTLTSREDNEKTICRISLYDQSNNPFGSVSDIMENIYDKDMSTLTHRINLAQRAYNSKASDAKKKNRSVSEKVKIAHQQKLSEIVEEFVFDKAKTDEVYGPEGVPSPLNTQNGVSPLAGFDMLSNGKFIDNLLSNTGISNTKISNTKRIPLTKKGNRAILELDKDSTGKVTSVKIISSSPISNLKARYKSIMPSITYGSQNSAIIEASVTTVNESKLNTVYLTRNYQSKTSENNKVKAIFEDELPLRIVPAQASITMFGCPFVNFAQYLFLDFETGTTLDNTYFVTGIKHDLTPGKFTTQLTLSYGDIYGKYENMASTIQKAVNQFAGFASLPSQDGTPSSEATPSEGATVEEVAKDPSKENTGAKKAVKNQKRKKLLSKDKASQNIYATNVFTVYFFSTSGQNKTTSIYPLEASNNQRIDENSVSSSNKDQQRQRVTIKNNKNILQFTSANGQKNSDSLKPDYMATAKFNKFYTNLTYLTKQDILGGIQVKNNNVISVNNPVKDDISGRVSLIDFRDPIYNDNFFNKAFSIYKNLIDDTPLGDLNKPEKPHSKEVSFSYEVSQYDISVNVKNTNTDDVVQIQYSEPQRKINLTGKESLSYSENCKVAIDISIKPNKLNTGSFNYLYFDLLSSPFFINRRDKKTNNLHVNLDKAIIESIKDFKTDIQLLNKYKLFRYITMTDSLGVKFKLNNFFYKKGSKSAAENSMKALILRDDSSNLYKKKWANSDMDSLFSFEFNAGNDQEEFEQRINGLKHELINAQNIFLKELALGSYSNKSVNCCYRQEIGIKKKISVQSTIKSEVGKKILYFKNYKKFEDLVKKYVILDIFDFNTQKELYSHSISADGVTNTSLLTNLDTFTAGINKEHIFDNKYKSIKINQIFSDVDSLLLREFKFNTTHSMSWKDHKINLVDNGGAIINNKKNKSNKVVEFSVMRKAAKKIAHINFDRCMVKILELFVPLDWDELYFEDKKFTIKKEEHK